MFRIMSSGRYIWRRAPGTLNACLAGTDIGRDAAAGAAEEDEFNGRLPQNFEPCALTFADAADETAAGGGGTSTVVDFWAPLTTPFLMTGTPVGCFLGTRCSANGLTFGTSTSAMGATFFLVSLLYVP